VPVLALLHQRALHLQRFVIRHAAEVTNVEWPQGYTCDGSKVSIPFFRSAMN
jgi:hypothetical protein